VPLQIQDFFIFSKIWARILERFVQMHEAVWESIRVLGETAALPVMLTNEARTISFLNNTKHEVDSFVRGCRTFDAESCFSWRVLPTAESVIEVD
jgi:hypothetical protein